MSHTLVKGRMYVVQVFGSDNYTAILLDYLVQTVQWSNLWLEIRRLPYKNCAPTHLHALAFKEMQVVFVERPPAHTSPVRGLHLAPPQPNLSVHMHIACVTAHPSCTGVTVVPEYPTSTICVKPSQCLKFSDVAHVLAASSVQ
jgi:hypothetical protein